MCLFPNFIRITHCTFIQNLTMFSKNKIYLPLEIQRKVFYHLINTSNPKDWKKYMLVNSLWFDEVCQIVYRDLTAFCSYWEGGVGIEKMKRTPVGTLDRFSQQYARYGTMLYSSIVSRKVINFNSPWIRVIRVEWSDDPHLWIQGFLKSRCLEKFQLTSLKSCYETQNQPQTCLKELSTIFGEYIYPVEIQFDLLMNQLGAFSTAPLSFLKKVKILTLKNRDRYIQEPFIFTKARVDSLLKFTSVKHINILCEIVTEIFFPELLNMFRNLEGLSYEYVKTPRVYRSEALDYFTQLPGLRNLTLELSDSCLDFTERLYSKQKKCQWNGIEQLELLFNREWVHNNKKIFIQRSLKELFDFFPNVKNLTIHAARVHLYCIFQMQHLDAPTLNGRYFIHKDKVFSHYFRSKETLIDMTPYILLIGTKCRLLETLLLNGATVNIKEIWKHNKKRLKKEPGNVSFPRLILLEVDKAFGFNNKGPRRWMQKQMRYCAVSSSNYYF